MRYDVPAGWRTAQNVGRLRVLEGPEGSSLYVGPGAYTTTDEAVKDLSAFLSTLGIVGQPMSPPVQSRVANMPALSMTLQLRDRTGRDLRAVYTCVISPHGTGLNLLGVAAPQQLEQTRASADKLLATLVMGAPVLNQTLMQAIGGKWTLYSGSSDRGGSGSISTGHDETVEFDGRGRFAWQSSSYTSGSVSGTSVTGDSQQADAGSYSIIGNTLIFRGRTGTLAVDFTYDAHHLSAGGRTFIR